MADHYTISDFYLLLKLGLFKGGKVGNWGYVSASNLNSYFLDRPISEYHNKPLIKKQLSIGLYLLNLYLLSQKGNQRTYIMIMSVCRTTLEKEEKIYVLSLTSTYPVDEMQTAIIEGNLSKRRKSVFRRKARKATFEAAPINSVSRKY